jgi:hypothetical protein
LYQSGAIAIIKEWGFLVDLIDLVGEKGIQQDEWSLTAPTFGKEDQLEVVGWSGKSRGRSKLYILKCNKCSKDSELFGDGYFRSKKGDLVRGRVPCGCSRKAEWSKEQYFILCSRKARELGYTFLGFEGEWKGRDNKIRMLCEKHGEWLSGSIDGLIHKGQGCPGCGVDAVAEARTKPDDVMIASFLASDSFHPDTKFWRSERECSRGKKAYWYMSCPECGEVGETQSGNLQLGKRSCACSKHRQQECYINWLIDDHNNAVAIKFGIARDSKQRIKQQDSKSVYTLKQHSIYVFPSVQACKKAERECKKELETGVVLKRDMPDGYSETTWAYNIGRVKTIYERNGGVIHDGYV